MRAVTELGLRCGVAPSCAVLGVARATWYRRQQPQTLPRPTPARALSLPERQTVLATLHEPRFVDLAPAEISNDNPFSESQFNTLKYRPGFPERFGGLGDARGFCGDFFPWYNMEHHHTGRGLFTPHDVHHGLAEKRREARAAVLAAAFEQNPERFPNGKPLPAALPPAVWISPPKVRAVAK